MPKIATFKNFIFFFYSFDLTERIHLHISKSKNYSNYAKIWLDTLEVEYLGDLSNIEMNECIKIISKNKNKIISLIEKYKETQDIKSLKL